MNVTEMTGETGNQSTSHVWKIMGPISFSIILGLLLVAYILYRQAQKENKETLRKENELLKELNIGLPQYEETEVEKNGEGGGWKAALSNWRN